MLTNHKTYSNKNLRDVQKTFNDGICYLYGTDERELVEFKGKFHFSNESIGISHYWEAHNSNVAVDRAIGIPCNDLTIDSQDVIKIEDTFYTIARIQYKDYNKPRYWQLTLSKEQFSYTERDSDRIVISTPSSAVPKYLTAGEEGELSL